MQEEKPFQFDTLDMLEQLYLQCAMTWTMFESSVTLAINKVVFVVKIMGLTTRVVIEKKERNYARTHDALCVHFTNFVVCGYRAFLPTLGFGLCDATNRAFGRLHTPNIHFCNCDMQVVTTLETSIVCLRNVRILFFFEKYYVISSMFAKKKHEECFAVKAITFFLILVQIKRVFCFYQIYQNKLI